MNEVVTAIQQLPDTLEDLTQFVLVNKAKLQAYMLKLRTVEKLDTAQAIKDQTLKDSQEIASALLAAEQRIGELLLAIPKASGQYAESKNRPVSKNTLIKDMGYSKDEAADYQQMAKNPEIVEKVIKDAIASGEVPTKSEVTKNIRFQKQIEVIEHNANEPLKKQVRNGEKTINQAWLELKKQNQKEFAIGARERLGEAQKRHNEFKEQKTVSMEAVKQDQKDFSEIAESKAGEIQNALKKILFIGAASYGGDMDFSEIKKSLSKTSYLHLVTDISNAISILSKLKEWLA